jgi:hypothetical protein
VRKSPNAWFAVLVSAACATGAHPALAQNAAAYVIAPSGSDSAACSLASPCATLAHAQALMQTTPVKTTYLMSGTFALVAPLRLTAQVNGETFSAYPGQTPSLVPGASTFSTSMLIEGAGNIVISGLALSNAEPAGDSGDCLKVVASADIILRRNQIGPCGGNGVHITGGTGNQVLDSYIHTDHRPTAANCCDVNEGVRVDGYASYVSSPAMSSHSAKAISSWETRATSPRTAISCSIRSDHSRAARTSNPSTRPT